MLRYLIAYGATAVAFLAIDLIWLGVVAKRFYARELGSLLLERPNMTAAAAFYLLYVVGIVYFAVGPALRDGAPSTALVQGAMLGLIAYATYDLTNYATLRNWSLAVTLVDMAWGAAVTAAAAVAGFFLTRLLTDA